MKLMRFYLCDFQKVSQSYLQYIQVYSLWLVTLYIIVFIQVNTLRPRQNGHHFADDIFKCIFLNENVWILIKISLKFVPKGPINNIPSLVQIMVLAPSRRQAIIWTNDGKFTDAYMRQSASMS